MSVDPVIVDPTNTQAINPYSYVMNNPLAYTDPSGYIRVCDTLVACDGDQIMDDTFNKTIGGLGGNSGSAGNSDSSSNGATGSSTLKLTGAPNDLADIGSELEKTGARLIQGRTNEDGTAEAIYGFGGNGTYDPNINVELWKTIGNSALQAAGNLVPDLVNGLVSWTERFLHRGDRTLGRMSDWVESRNVVSDEIVSDMRVAASGILILAPLKGRVAVSEGMTRAGRWMSVEELTLMKQTNRMQEGSGGLTFAATSGSSSFIKQAKSGSVFVEFNVNKSNLLQGGRVDWVKALGPSAPRSQKFMLQKQGGELLPRVTDIVVGQTKN